MRLYASPVLKSYSNKSILGFRRCVELREIEYVLQKLADLFDCVTFVETNYLNTDLYKSESSQSHENSPVGRFLESSKHRD